MLDVYQRIKGLCFPRARARRGPLEEPACAGLSDPCSLDFELPSEDLIPRRMMPTRSARSRRGCRSASGIGSSLAHASTLSSMRRTGRSPRASTPFGTGLLLLWGSDLAMLRRKAVGREGRQTWLGRSSWNQCGVSAQRPRDRHLVLLAGWAIEWTLLAISAPHRPRFGRAAADPSRRSMPTHPIFVVERSLRFWRRCTPPCCGLCLLVLS